MSILTKALGMGFCLLLVYSGPAGGQQVVMELEGGGQQGEIGAGGARLVSEPWEKSVERLGGLFRELSRENESLKNTNLALREETKGELEGISARLDELVGVLDESLLYVRQRLAAEEKKIEELRGERGALGELLSQKTAGHRAAEEALKARIGELSTSLADGERRMASLENDLAGRDAMISELREEIKKVRGGLAETRRRAERIGSEKEKLREDLESLRSEVGRVERKRKEEIARLEETYKHLSEELEEDVRRKEVALRRLEEALSVGIVDEALFPSGSAELTPRGISVLRRAGEILKGFSSGYIAVKGHTDDVPIGEELRGKYPTNWELSAARAARVVRFLRWETGLDPTRIAVVAHGEYLPVASNDTAEGRARNRRIEIVLFSETAGGVLFGEGVSLREGSSREEIP